MKALRLIDARQIGVVARVELRRDEAEIVGGGDAAREGIEIGRAATERLRFWDAG